MFVFWDVVPRILGDFTDVSEMFVSETSVNIYQNALSNIIMIMGE
jgi:hypothetical protein